MSSDLQSLDSILDGKAPETVSAPQETVVETPVSEATGEKPSASVPPAEASQEQSPAANDPPHVPRKALEDERRKRQDLEKQLKDMQARFSPQPLSQPSQANPQQAQPQQPAQDIPDPVLEPERFVRWQQVQMATQLFANNVRVSQRMMREKHQDYDEIEAIFAEEANRDPVLARQLLQSDFPAEFAYTHGKRLKLMREIGDNPDAYIEAKVAERLAQQGSQREPQAPPARPPVPKSLAAVPNAQPRDDRGRYAPASLSDILD